eukprot:s1_g1513.t1
MMFLVRIAFWVTVVALVLPTPDSATPPGGTGGSAMTASFSEERAEQQLNLTDVAGAAMTSADDVLSFCDRNPQTCETGWTIAIHVQRQIKHYGALALDWVASQQSSNTPAHHPRARPSEAPSPSVEVVRGA